MIPNQVLLSSLLDSSKTQPSLIHSIHKTWQESRTRITWCWWQTICAISNSFRRHSLSYLSTGKQISHDLQAGKLGHEIRPSMSQSKPRNEQAAARSKTKPSKLPKVWTSGISHLLLRRPKTEQPLLLESQKPRMMRSPSRKKLSMLQRRKPKRSLALQSLSSPPPSSSLVCLVHKGSSQFWRTVNLSRTFSILIRHQEGRSSRVERCRQTHITQLNNGRVKIHANCI